MAFLLNLNVVDINANFNFKYLSYYYLCENKKRKT